MSKKWDKKELSYLRKHYGTMSNRDLAATRELRDHGGEMAIRRKASRLGLRKSKKYLKQMGR